MKKISTSLVILLLSVSMLISSYPAKAMFRKKSMGLWPQECATSLTHTVTKRLFSSALKTQGYQPKECARKPLQDFKFETVLLPKKVTFIDKRGELYLPLSIAQSVIREVKTPVQVDDHTLLLDLQNND